MPLLPLIPTRLLTPGHRPCNSPLPLKILPFLPRSLRVKQASHRRHRRPLPLRTSLVKPCDRPGLSAVSSRKMMGKQLKQTARGTALLPPFNIHTAFAYQTPLLRRYHVKKYALVALAVARLKKIMERKKVVIKQEQQDEVRVCEQAACVVNVLFVTSRAKVGSHRNVH
jgi:hypothetical protein